MIAALIEAGADVDGRLCDGCTPLFLAVLSGHLNAVKELLRAEANPLLTGTGSWSGMMVFPLDMAVCNDHLRVVRELIVSKQQRETFREVGIERCDGGGGGEGALYGSVMNALLEIMAMLLDAGKVDNTEVALLGAVGCGRDSSKFLLQQRRQPGRTSDVVGYVTLCDIFGITPLFQSIHAFSDDAGVPFLVSPKVVRMLIDAGAYTSSVVCAMNRPMNPPGNGVFFNSTPSAFANFCLGSKVVGRGQTRGMKDATEKQMYRLEAVRRLLLPAEAVHAVSWLWVRKRLLVGGAAQVSRSRRRPIRKTPTNGTPMTFTLSILRRRRRGVLLAALIRWDLMSFSHFAQPFIHNFGV